MEDMDDKNPCTPGSIEYAGINRKVIEISSSVLDSLLLIQLWDTLDPTVGLVIRKGSQGL